MTRDLISNRRRLSIGGDHFRVGPWHADPTVAHLSVTADRQSPRRDHLAEALRVLGSQGYHQVITSALHFDEAGLFFGFGFEEFDRLRVLGHDLIDLDPPRPALAPGVGIRRAHRRDRPAALRVDALAFPPFWRLDESGLDDAVRATPRHRFRVADQHGVITGYAVTGRAGSQGFLQRLAVVPAADGNGIGSSLVVDALHWAARRKVGRLLVNTQEDNHRALALYHRLGFKLTPTDLVVLRRSLS